MDEQKSAAYAWRAAHAAMMVEKDTI